MEQHLQVLLQISAKLYDKLTINPEESKRDEFIIEIDELLDKRGILIKVIVEKGFKYNADLKNHRMLFELDKGIHERLNRVLLSVKQDMKDLQATKKSEQQYMNPYSHMQTIDGMYYDTKK